MLQPKDLVVAPGGARLLSSALLHLSPLQQSGLQMNGRG